MGAIDKETTIGIVGAGAMGAGIAQVAAAAGHRVLLFDAQVEAASAGIARIDQGLERLLSKGKISPQERSALIQRIAPVETLRALAPAGLVIEAIVEDLAVKQKVLSELETICGQDTILASNTSSISITAIGAALTHPQRLAGMHFFNPAPVMKLVEIVSGLASERHVLQTLAETAERWGKVAVHARSTPGFIVNRVARPFYAEALRILGEGGTDVATIDALMREAGGFRMGPFQLMDLIGNDINYAVTCSVFAAYYHDPRFKPSLIQQEMVNGGLLGRKTGRGYYDYANDADTIRISTATLGPKPTVVARQGQLGSAKTLLERGQRAGIATDNGDADGDSGFVFAGIHLLAADGRTASARAAASGHSQTVTFDLALDYTTCTRLALAAADQADPQAIVTAAGYFQAMGIQVAIIDDIAGMVVLRTVAMLANEAADAVHQGVASVTDVDQAMRHGVNYPQGPLAWADAIGLRRVVATLDHLATHYGEDRYRVSPLLRRRALSGGTLHG